MSSKSKPTFKPNFGYSLYKNKDTEKFEIKELATENIMFIGETHQEASTIYRRLKKNIGFLGWTPSFVLKKVA